MESKLFSRFDPKQKENEPFAKDLRQLLDLSTKQRCDVMSGMVLLAREKTERGKKTIYNEVSAKSGLMPLILLDSVGVVRFFVRAFLQEDTESDTPEAWASDLQTLELVDASQVAVFIEFFEGLRDQVLPELKQLAQERAYGAGVLPALQGSGTTVELRGVFEKPFSWGTALDDYEPELLDVIPVVSVHLSFDSGMPDEIWFQATPDEIELLIGEFRAALKAVEVLHNRSVQNKG